jgi:small conductance mechanosensitive channel
MNDLFFGQFDVIVAFAWNVLMALAILIVGFYLAGLLTKLLTRGLFKANVEITVKKFLATIISVILKILVVISAISTLGVNTTSFAAILAAAGLAIGLALQGSLANFAGGVLILFFKTFKVGDFIKTSSHAGIVEEIQIFYTIMRTFDNQEIIIPNGQLSNNIVINVNKKPKRRVDVVASCSYFDDVVKVRKVLQELIASCPNKLEDEQHVVFMTELDDSSINFAVRVWVNTLVNRE